MIEKYLLPYKEHKNGLSHFFTRSDINGRYFCQVWKGDWGNWYCSRVSRPHRFKSAEAAMIAMDKRLLELGYLLLTEDRSKKLKSLLP